MDFHIRVAEPKDAATILSLMEVFSESLKNNYDPSEEKLPPMTKISAAELAHALDKRDINTFLAFDKESSELAGMISCYEGFSCWDAKYLSMHHMFVVPKFQRRGLARRLTQELASFAILIDAPLIYWTVEDENMGGQSFYKSIGAYDLIHTRNLRVWRLKEEQILDIIDCHVNNGDVKPNSVEFQIREAKPSDSAQILALSKEMAPVIGLENQKLIAEESLSEALQCGKFHSLLAFCGGDFAGMLNYSFGYALWHGTILHMRSPYIRQKFRHMSLDRFLLQEIARLAVSKGIRTIDCDFADNEENNPFEMDIRRKYDDTRHPFVLEKEMILQLSQNQ